MKFSPQEKKMISNLVFAVMTIFTAIALFYVLDLDLIKSQALPWDNLLRLHIGSVHGSDYDFQHGISILKDEEEGRYQDFTQACSTNILQRSKCLTLAKLMKESLIFSTMSSWLCDWM